ncbi:MAG TPA: response regulator [Polyangiales bacterium]
MSVAPRTHRPPRPRKILAIDDSKTVLASLRRALEQAGFAVQTACDPAEISALDAQSAAAVVVDVQMEHVFGDDVVSFLRDVWNVSAPIYLFSSLPIQDLNQRARSAGANGAVCKSEGVEALLAQLNRALQAP